MQTPRFNAIWISDTRLGLRACKAEFLLDFLRHTECGSLYLVGDMIDFWHMKKGMRWPALHNSVIQEVMCKAGRGTRVIYVPGNHDELFRDCLGTSFGRARPQTRGLPECRASLQPGSLHPPVARPSQPGTTCGFTPERDEGDVGMMRTCTKSRIGANSH